MLSYWEKRNRNEQIFKFIIVYFKKRFIYTSTLKRKIKNNNYSSNYQHNKINPSKYAIKYNNSYVNSLITDFYQ